MPWLRSVLCPTLHGVAPLATALLILIAGPSQGLAADWLTPRVTPGPNGTMEISFQGDGEHYYVLYHRPTLADEEGEFPVAMHLGQEGVTTLTEPLGIAPSQSSITSLRPSSTAT